MSKLIKKLESNFTVISNNILKNEKISLQAKGLYAFIISLPEDWDFKIRGLANLTGEGETKISNALLELEKWSLVKRQLYKNEKGNFDVDYIISDKPNFIENYVRPIPQIKGAEVLTWEEKQSLSDEESNTTQENPVPENLVQENLVQENPLPYIRKDIQRKDIQRKDINIIYCENEFSPKNKPKDINFFIDKFYKINKMVNFSNKTQRKAIEDLLKKMGEDKLEKTIDYALSLLDTPYAPTITTPLELKNKLLALMSFYQKDIKTKKKGGITVLNV